MEPVMRRNRAHGRKHKEPQPEKREERRENNKQHVRKNHRFDREASSVSPKEAEGVSKKDWNDKYLAQLRTTFQREPIKLQQHA